MISNGCPSLFKCHKIRGVLDRDGSVEQMVNEVNAICGICLGPRSFSTGKTPSLKPFPSLAHMWQ